VCVSSSISSSLAWRSANASQSVTFPPDQILHRCRMQTLSRIVLLLFLTRHVCEQAEREARKAAKEAEQRAKKEAKAAEAAAKAAAEEAALAELRYHAPVNCCSSFCPRL
jgi:hypothetical protein